MKIKHIIVVLATASRSALGFTTSKDVVRSSSVLLGATDSSEPVKDFISRRHIIQSTLMTAFAASVPSKTNAADVKKAQQLPLEDYLYKIIRVKEATTQEARLIKTGKFKDVQRANVKLAVRFMLQNYRLNDAFVQASGFLPDTDRRLQAGQVGQSVVQNLQTILEYFDSSDVENIKVGSSDNMAGKEGLVLRGLDSTRKGIEDFLSFFPASQVELLYKQVETENALNVKEFDPALGDLLNMPPPS